MLELRDVHAWYGAAQALVGVNLRVRPQELVVLQGLNGAGKSTLLQAIMGIGPRVQGFVGYQNRSISGLPSYQRARLGLGFVAEDRRLFTALSVRENLLVAARAPQAHARGWAALSVARRLEQVLTLFPALSTMLERSAAQMSGGEQQMLGLARTLMTGPTLLLLDEPCEGIAPMLVASIRDAVLELKREGMSLLVAEQNGILAARADRVITLKAQTPLHAD
ncbi:MAG: ATP-binding cassette domain-containing protein [Rhodoferax sp.]